MTNPFKVGHRVKYTPVLFGRKNPSLAEVGTVSAVDAQYAYVRFDTHVESLGWDGALARQVSPSMLSPCPTRVQRMRKKGWRKPFGVVNVARPSKWGNPFETAKEFDEAVSLVIDNPPVLLDDTPAKMKRILAIVADIEELRARSLMCFCPLDKPCHADTLMKHANRE